MRFTHRLLNHLKIEKNNPFLKEKFAEVIDIFKNNPFDARLKTHKLSGKLKDLYSFSIGYDLRVIFFFYNDNQIVLQDIGKHDTVY